MKGINNEPKKVAKTKIDYVCPTCGKILWEEINSKEDCIKCGQKLDWKLNEEGFCESDVI